MLVESCFHLLTTDLRCRNFWNGRIQTRVCYFSEEFFKTFFEGIFFFFGCLEFCLLKFSLYFSFNMLLTIDFCALKKKLSDKLGPQWSKGELQRFYEAYRNYGKDWKKVRNYPNPGITSVFLLHC